ncbi:LysR substrate-binding domain-containing protein [Rhizobium sp. FKY42]|uniref:LysR substrate-binding domain-containing protein n=1 Tax=Rhizobium sp. FKY42 TaxID=2562310 RepID=UPI0010C12C8A|nr:LysR substrate-binding domain-containing protein [Rhizobium sp. FKY42]
MTLNVSLGAVRTFIEVGRQGSIKRAAQQLNVTPGAVSQQMKALEARFGVQLFERRNREVKLSTQGLRLFDKLKSGFEQIEAALQMFEVRGPRSRSLVVSTTPSFASCWLTPRLGRFANQHPDIDIRLETSAQLADMTSGMVDVAIRHGCGTYPGLDAALLFTPRLVAVASPLLLDDCPLPSPADCLRYPLLQDRDRADWSAWFAAHGVKPTKYAMKGLTYADDALLIQGAIAGQGLAIVRDVYAACALEAGSLVLAVNAAVPTQAKYFVVAQSGRVAVPKIAAFRQWILDEASIAPMPFQDNDRLGL